MPDRTHLASLIEDFRRHGSQTAMVERRGLRTVATSYEQLAGLAGRCARELESRGIRKGDRVVIQGESGSEWIAAFFGCVLRGVVAVPLDATGSEEFTRRVVRETGAKLVFGSAELAHAQALQPLLEPVPG